jgi:hypothetical protein
MVRVVIVDGTVQRIEQLDRGFIEVPDAANPQDAP